MRAARTPCENSSGSEYVCVAIAVINQIQARMKATTDSGGISLSTSLVAFNALGTHLGFPQEPQLGLTGFETVLTDEEHRTLGA